jgi:hypothetical protein
MASAINRDAGRNSTVLTVDGSPRGVSTKPNITGLPVDQQEFKSVCPVHAISVNPERIDLGKCVFCEACAKAFPSKVQFSDEYKMTTNVRDRLVLLAGENNQVSMAKEIIRPEISAIANLPIRLHVINMSDEPVSITNTFLKPYNIELVSSANEAHGLIIFSAVTNNEGDRFKEAYHNLLPPKLIILAGTTSITENVSGNADGLFDRITIDLYVPGQPVHPLNFAEGILELIKQ